MLPNKNTCPDLITVNNFTHWIRESNIITRYGDDIQILPPNNFLEVYCYSDAILKHLPVIKQYSLITTEKTLLYSVKPVQYTGDVNRCPNNNANATNRTDENVTERLQKFTNMIRTNETCRILLRCLCNTVKVNHPIKINLKITCMFETDTNKLFRSNRQLNLIADNAKKHFTMCHLISTNKFDWMIIFDNISRR